MHRYQSTPIVIITLILTIVAVFWEVKNHEFVNFDDDVYITKNYHVQAGLTKESVKWAFTTIHSSNWHPLTWLSHMLDYQIYGLDPKGHHLNSLLFHIINTLLLFLILKRATGGFWQSVLVAALFGVHPLHVESVAWVSERKDVLSTLFWMLTLWAYIRYTERPCLKRYILILACFAFGLMAKPMLVTLPFVMLLLDYWPLNRFQLNQLAGNNNPQRGQGHNQIELPLWDREQNFAKKIECCKFVVQPNISTNRAEKGPVFLHLVLEKMPFFVLSIVSSIITFVAQQRGGAMASMEIIPFHLRVANTFISYIRYIEKMIWPYNLAVFYPHPGNSLSIWQAVGAGFVLMAISTIAFKTARNSSYFVVGWLWYIGTLVPVIGLVQVGAQSMADRYTYVPLIGLFIIVAWGGGELLNKMYFKKIVFILLSASMIISCMVLAWPQVQYWRNSITLFEHTLNVTDNNHKASYNLGVALSKKWKIKKAIFYFEKALLINPNYAEPYNSLGVAMGRQGKLKEAIGYFSRALSIKPDFANAHYNMGMAFSKLRKPNEAIYHYSEALKTRPNDPDTLYKLGVAFTRIGKSKNAIENFTMVLKIKPNHVPAKNDLGISLARVGKIKEAIRLWQDILRRNPNFTQARQNLELALARKKK